MALKGSCLCGAIRFEVDKEPVAQAICHCTDCQHEGGSFSASGVFPPGSLKYTKGEPVKYNKPGASGKNVEHNFCGKCGSTMVIMQESLDGAIIVRTGCFSDESNSGTDWYNPQVEFWNGSKQKWLKDFPQMKQFPQGPSNA